MHEKILTRAEPPRAFLERLDPRIKLACTLVWAISVVTIPERHASMRAAHALILLVVLTLSRRCLGKFLRRFGTALPFIVLLTILLPFFKEGQVLWQLGPIEVTREGWWAAQRIAASALLCVAAICLVWATTPEPDLIAGLSGMGLPAMFVGVIAFMLRYLHVLRPQLHRLWDARAARVIGHCRPAPFHSAANLLGAFFVRSQQRALRVADAMAARGYDGQWRATRQLHWRVMDAVLGGLFLAAVVLLRWMPWS